MLGIKLKDRIRNADIRAKTKVTNILTCIDCQKWGSTGKMLRNKINKWSKRITTWYPRNGNISQGHPKTRWEDDIRQKLGPYWIRVAENRTGHNAGS